MNRRKFFTNNRWWGKFFGAFFGYLIAGPAGALFGILIGNFFDRSLVIYYNRPHWYYRNERQQIVQKLFFKATFSIMGYLAKADGRVSEQEILMAKTLMNEMRLNHQQQIMAQGFFNEGKAPHFDLRATVNTLQAACQDNPDLLKFFVDIQFRAAQVDGLTKQKVQAFDRLLRELGFAPLHQQFHCYEDFTHASYSSHSHNQYRSSQSRGYQRNDSKSENSLLQAYTLLELNQNADKHEVKRAYRRLISRNHPDKLIAKGLPEEMIKIANDKTQQITKAYEKICASRGW